MRMNNKASVENHYWLIQLEIAAKQQNQSGFHPRNEKLPNSNYLHSVEALLLGLVWFRDHDMNAGRNALSGQPNSP